MFFIDCSCPASCVLCLRTIREVRICDQNMHRPRRYATGKRGHQHTTMMLSRHSGMMLLVFCYFQRMSLDLLPAGNNVNFHAAAY